MRNNIKKFKTESGSTILMNLDRVLKIQLGQEKKSNKTLYVIEFTLDAGEDYVLQFADRDKYEELVSILVNSYR